MDVLFVVPSMSPYLMQECRGTLELARILKNNGISVDLFRYWQADFQLDNFTKLVSSMIEYVEKNSSHILSFYCRCDTYHIVWSVAKEIKKSHSEITILFGGPQAEISAQETLRAFPYVDYICCGEGESTILPLVNSILSGHPDNSIEGLLYRSNDGTIITNDLPDLISDNYIINCDYYKLIPELVIENSKQTAIEVGRGCPFNCSFCSSKTFWKRKFRLRDIDDIINEVRYVYESYGISVLRFEHDIFTADKKRLQLFCEKMIESELPILWRCSSRIDTIDDEMVVLMKQAGLQGIYFGIETGSERMQNIIHKGLSIKEIRNTLLSCINMGVEVTASFMYGFPQETIDDVRDTLNLICDLLDMGVHRIQLHLVDFLQGTELFDEYKENLVFDGNVSNIATQFGVSECSFIQEHSDIFSSFFNYPSELRVTLDIVEEFVRCYMKFRESMHQVRVLVGGDALEMYIIFRSVVTNDNKRIVGKEKNNMYNDGLRIRNGKYFRKDDIKKVTEFYSKFDSEKMQTIYASFSRELDVN